MGMAAHRRALLFLTAFTVFAFTGCGGSSLGKGDKTPAAPTCGDSGGTVRPMVLTWSAADRASMQAAAKSGVVVVRFDGCALEIMDDCRLPGEYAFDGTAVTTERLVIDGVPRLREEFPIASDDLERRLKGGGELLVEYLVTGTRTAKISDRSKGMLLGRCEGATHFVRGIVVGAYEVTEKGVDERVEWGGDLDGCVGSHGDEKSPDCGAVVQLVLTPLEEMTTDRDDLYHDLNRTMAADETLNALQMLQEMMEAAGDDGDEAPQAQIEPGEGGPLVESIMAIPDGGSDRWDDLVKTLMLENFDSDGSGSIDTTAEVAGIPCHVLQALNNSIRQGRGGVSELRTTYGFPPRFQWVGYALGFHEKVRAKADARLENCGL